MYNRGQFRTARYNSIRQYHNLFTSAKQTPALVHSVTKIGSPMEVGQILSTRHACHHEELQTLLEVSACLTELYTLCVSTPVPVHARRHTSRLYYILYHLHIYTLCKFTAWPQKTLLLTWRFFLFIILVWVELSLVDPVFQTRKSWHPARRTCTRVDALLCQVHVYMCLSCQSQEHHTHLISKRWRM